MEIFNTGRVVRVELTRRNLLALLTKLDQPGSARTLVKDANPKLAPDVTRLVIVAVEDDAHYSNRLAGDLHPATLALMPSVARGVSGGGADAPGTRPATSRSAQPFPSPAREEGEPGSGSASRSRS